MESSLCGRSPCPQICVRVCHCEAGLARSRWLLARQKEKRELSRTRAASKPRKAPAWLKASSSLLGALFGQHIGRKETQRRGTAALRKKAPTLGLSCNFLIATLLLLALVLAWGYLQYGSSLTPVYKAENVITYDYWWQEGK